MSAELDNQPYDNVEFPIRRPVHGPGGWSSQGVGPQRANLIIGGQSLTLAPVAEGGGIEEEEELFTVDDQRQKGTTTRTTTTTSITTANVSFCTNSIATSTATTTNTVHLPKSLHYIFS